MTLRSTLVFLFKLKGTFTRPGQDERYTTDRSTYPRHINSQRSFVDESQRVRQLERGGSTENKVDGREGGKKRLVPQDSNLYIKIKS